MRYTGMKGGCCDDSEHSGVYDEECREMPERKRKAEKNGRRMNQNSNGEDTTSLRGRFCFDDLRRRTRRTGKAP